jgi:hypothetical protein
MPLVITDRACRRAVDHLGSVAAQLEGDLLQVEDDVGGVFHHAGDRLELVQHAFDLDRGDRAPSIEDSSTRRSALPMVVPNPRSNGCAQK